MTMRNRRVFCLAVAASLAASGCVHRTTVPLNMAPDEYFALNRAIAGRTAIVRYLDGGYEQLRYAALVRDSTTGSLSLSASGRHISPIDSVLTIEVRNSYKGATTGAKLGALIGGVCALLIKPCVKAEMNDDEPDLKPGTAFLAGALVGAVYGAGIGAIIKDRTIFDVSTQRPVLSLELQPGICSTPRTTLCFGFHKRF